MSAHRCWLLLLVTPLLVGCGTTPVSEIRSERPPEVYTAEQAPLEVLNRMRSALDDIGAKTEYIDPEARLIVGRIEHPVINDTLVRYVVEAEESASGSEVKIWAKPRGLIASNAERLWKAYQGLDRDARASAP